MPERKIIELKALVNEGLRVELCRADLMNQESLMKTAR
jgi:hypothetical protein